MAPCLETDENTLTNFDSFHRKPDSNKPVNRHTYQQIIGSADEQDIEKPEIIWTQ